MQSKQPKISTCESHRVSQSSSCRFHGWQHCFPRQQRGWAVATQVMLLWGEMELGYLFSLFVESVVMGRTPVLASPVFEEPSTFSPSLPRWWECPNAILSPKTCLQFLCCSLSRIKFIHILFLGEILSFPRLGRESPGEVRLLGKKKHVLL